MRKADVKNEIEFLRVFSGLAKSLQEVSVMKMQVVRDYVVKAREYKDGLSHVYRIVKISEKKQLKNKKLPKNTMRVETDKKAIVLLSANQRMFGSITQEVFEQFLEYIKNNDDNIIIIGKIGKNLYESYGVEKPYNYFDLKDMDITYIDLLPIISHLLQYKNINVFYGAYSSIFLQRPALSNVSGDNFLNTNVENNPLGAYKLEPSVESLENFFSGQIIGLLFRQAAYEYELSRHASRIQALENSLSQVEQRRKKNRNAYEKLLQSENTKKQLQNVVYLKRNR